MKNQLIPPPELAPPSVKHLPIETRIRLGQQLLADCNALLIAGIKARVGPEGDWQAAYREWYRRKMEEHDQMLVQYCENLTRRERAHAG